MKTAKQINDEQTGQIDVYTYVCPKCDKESKAKKPLSYCSECGTMYKKDCQSCLKEHDKEIKEELEKIIIIGQDIEWFQFWKERGIE